MPVTFITFVIGTAALMGVPLLSGFWSKEGILMAAFPHGDHGNGILFAMALFTAVLTAYYMTRLVVVAFLGKSRSKDADHAHEAPLVMILPLVFLAIPSIISGFDAPAHLLNAMTPHGHHEFDVMGIPVGKLVMGLSVAAVLVGYFVGVKVYRDKDKDPVRIPVFANKFYFDEFYAGLVKYAQDRVAWIVSALDKLLVGGVTMGLPAALSRAFGSGVRRVQSGGLQAYTFVLGLGIIIVVYLAVFSSAKN